MAYCLGELGAYKTFTKKKPIRTHYKFNTQYLGYFLMAQGTNDRLDAYFKKLFSTKEIYVIRMSVCAHKNTYT